MGVAGQQFESFRRYDKVKVARLAANRAIAVGDFQHRRRDHLESDTASMATACMLDHPAAQCALGAGWFALSCATRYFTSSISCSSLPAAPLVTRYLPFTRMVGVSSTWAALMSWSAWRILTSTPNEFALAMKVSGFTPATRA